MVCWFRLAQFVDIALHDRLAQRGREADKELGVPADAHNQIFMAFGVRERILQLFDRRDRHLYLDTAEGEIAFDEGLQ